MARILLAKARMIDAARDQIVPPLGAMYIASVLREAGHEVRIFDCGLDWDRPDHFRDALLAFRPDVVGLSAITQEGRTMEGMARVSKAALPGVPVMVGGPHASAYPERCARQRAVDFVVLGEGELTAVELVAALTRGGDTRSIAGLAWFDEAKGEVVFTDERANIEDVDAIPFPAWDLVDLDLYARCRSIADVGRRPYMLLFTSRGCPFKCIYCHEVQGKRFRARSPASVLREMDLLRTRHGINEFEVIDDIFNFDSGRMVEILDLAIASERRPVLHFPNALRTDLLDRAQIDRLYRAGTSTLSVAVETTSDRLQRMSKKYLKVQRVAENIDLAVDRGLYVRGFFMLGFPTETLAEARDTVEFAVRSRLHEAFFHLVTPFAGTALYTVYQELLEKRGITHDASDQMDYTKGHHNLSEMGDAELFALQQEGYRRFFFHPRRALRILARYPRRSRLIEAALRAAYCALPFHRHDPTSGVESAWTTAGVEADPVVAVQERETRVEPARRAAAVRAERRRLPLAPG